MVSITPDIQETHTSPNADTPRFLITMDKGIGDAVAVGLSAVEQIIDNDPRACGTIDVLCNPVQAQLFAYDPRINRIIATNCAFYPGPRMREWLRGIVIDDEASNLVRFLRERDYEAVLPAIVAPGLFYRLHARIMYPNIPVLAKNLLTLHKHPELRVSLITRQMVNRYFGNTCSQEDFRRAVTLYLCPEHVRKARVMLALVGASPLILVAPDTASIVTRPPTALLARSLATVLRQCPQAAVLILPGYTSPQASEHLFHALASNFAGRVTLLPAEPQLSLLETAVLVDQATVFLTGDTGVMHLAAATKRLASSDEQAHLLRNAKNTVVLFGGTNPDFYGYPHRTIIVGRGRKEQFALRPGFSKESYHPGDRDLFDHIEPAQVTEAIMNVLEMRTENRA